MYIDITQNAITHPLSLSSVRNKDHRWTVLIPQYMMLMLFVLFKSLSIDFEVSGKKKKSCAGIRKGKHDLSP